MHIEIMDDDRMAMITDHPDHLIVSVYIYIICIMHCRSHFGAGIAYVHLHSLPILPSIFNIHSSAKINKLKLTTTLSSHISLIPKLLILLQSW